LCDAKTVPHFATVGQTYGPTKQNAGNRVSIEQRLSMFDSREENMDLDTWVFGLQLVSLGFIAGLILGDFLDKMDPFHWKYDMRFREAKQMQPRTFSDDIGEDE
jgi:hypothetical protein